MSAFPLQRFFLHGPAQACAKLMHFLQKNGQHVIDSVEAKALYAMETFVEHHALEWSTFDSHDDSVLFSRLLSKSIELLSCYTNNFHIIDLGAGSCFTSLKVIDGFKGNRLIQFTAVERFLEPFLCAKRNITKLGFMSQYNLIHTDMFNYLNNNYKKGRNTEIFASNPPYVPIPYGTVDPFYDPVNGGPDGNDFLEKILLHPSLDSGCFLALHWSSLSHPLNIIDLIQAYYDILYISVRAVKFGKYTTKPPIKAHLLQQRLVGKAFFSDSTPVKEDSDELVHHYLVITTLLKKR